MNFLRDLFGKAESSPPSAETLEKAKKIFFEYSCSGLEMARNEVNFSQYHISREQEAAWRKEFIAYWRSRLSTEDLTAVQKLREADAVEAIPDLIAMADQGDSYAKLRVAEALSSIGYMANRSLRKQAEAVARTTARSLLDHPLQISEDHKADIARYGGSDPEEYIIMFAEEVVK